MTILDGIDALEDVVNGDGIASWPDVVEFFAAASFAVLFDLEVPYASGR